MECRLGSNPDRITGSPVATTYAISQSVDLRLLPRGFDSPAILWYEFRIFPGRFSPVNWVDLILLGLFALFGLRGYFRGFFRELFSLMGLVAGFMVAVAYDQEIAALFPAHWRVSPFFQKGLAFVSIFFIVYFTLNLIGSLLHRSERLMFLKTLNRTGGIALGLGKGAALCALVVFLLISNSLLSRPVRENFAGSYLVQPLEKLGHDLVRFGKDKILAGDSSVRL